MSRCRRRYVDGPQGQIHLRAWSSPAPGAQCPPLLCLHPVPYSGLFFDPLAPLLAEDRTVFAPDYPGYGGSDAPAREPTIADYAKAMAAVLGAVVDDRPVDLFGFHTGCLVAAEMALAQPERVRRVVMLDVPYFDAPTRDEKREAWAVPPAFGAGEGGLAAAWNRNVTKKIGQRPLARGLALFAEEMRAATRAHWGFRAAFAYPSEARFAALRTPVCVLASGFTLFEPSRAAAACIPDARLVELPDLAEPVIDSGAPRVAANTLEFLDR